MTYIKRINISGFRGILSPLEVPFLEGSKYNSVILYGANGTGKSSITDAWEWFITGKIQHLAREGAEEGAYPHMAAKPGGSFVEVEFSTITDGPTKLEYNHEKITKPIASDNLSQARQLITHPCHIRYGDLTRFVLQKKAERYDALASLMGFVPQMEFQKALRRVQTNFEKEVIQQESLKKDADARLKQHFNLPDIDVTAALLQLAQVCKGHGIQADPTVEGIKVANSQVQNLVAQDLKAKKLADLQLLETAITACEFSKNIRNEISALKDALGRVRAVQQEQLSTQFLIPLFQAADEMLSNVQLSGECPLCGKQFEGDLRQHIKNELAKMRHLQELLNHLNACQKTISNTLAAQKILVQTFDSTLHGAKPEVKKEVLEGFRTLAQEIDASLAKIRGFLVFDSTAISSQLVGDLTNEGNYIGALAESFQETKVALLQEIHATKDALNRDPARLGLVNDANFIIKGWELVQEIETKAEKLKGAQEVLTDYLNVVDSYIAECLADVQKRFDEISEKVKVYFETLEKHTQGLGAPKLKLLPDQDRSVLLEVFFHGNAVSPAYKYLSESQLNSFGLAVFLASATHFNRECQFLILDDVVNSFDAYKRPLLIDLIKGQLQNRQILLLTHDRFWRDLLYRTLPSWKKVDFTGYNFGVGPTVSSGLDTRNRVENHLERDEPEEACRILYLYVEDVLQEIIEKFECEIKFNRRNEYTLDTLVDRLRIRVEKKLKIDHPLTKALVEMCAATAYRNWVMHSKNPDAGIHKLEVQEVLSKWKVIESYVFCREVNCYQILKYDGNDSFRCPCGTTLLSKSNDAK